MIVELFGPPGVGKTTLAFEVAARLRDRGRRSRLALSYRPAEAPLPGHARGWAHLRPPASLTRLARPLIEILPMAGRSGRQTETEPVGELVRLLPPKSALVRLRLAQYVIRLSRCWHDAARSDNVVLFDQAFFQAIYTYALCARSIDPERVAHAVDAVPKPDLLVRLGASQEVLELRLAERRRRQRAIERLCDRWTSLDSLWIFDRLEELSRAHGLAVARVTSHDRVVLDAEADRVAAIIVGLGPAAAADRAAE